MIRINIKEISGHNGDNAFNTGNIIRLCTSSSFQHVQRPRHLILVFWYDVQAEYRRHEYQGWN